MLYPVLFPAVLIGLVVLLGLSLGTALAADSSAASTSPAAMAARVDQQLAVEIPVTASPQAAPIANDETFLRRVSLDLIGRPPTPEQMTRFVLDSSPDKRARQVERLLAEDHYAENWGRYWRDVIFYRRTEERALFAVDACTDYLTEQFKNNTPWDQIATAFITATGDVQEHGEAGIILAQGGETEGTVAEISRIFLGIQIQCAQCHDHPTDRWKREQFHQLAAFFPRVALRPGMPIQQRTFTVTVTDSEPRFRPRNNNMRVIGTLEHHMPDLKDPTAKGTLMQPVLFVSGQKLETGVNDSERRSQLAQWITARENSWFAQALVNRLWSELVGEGFYEPVDDMGPDRECSAPQTLKLLAEAFAANNYDLKWLFRTITSTQTYQRASRPRRNPDDPPFLANVAQRLRGDQLFGQLAVLMNLDDREPPRATGPNAPLFRRSPRQQFNTLFGFDPSAPRDEVSGSIPQALALMNGPNISQAIGAQRGLLGRLLNATRDNDQLIVELYLRALSREPSVQEVEVCQKHFQEAPTRGEASEDILWSLVNSTEFLHRP